MSAIGILPTPPDNFSTTLSGSISDTDLTVPLNSVANLPTEGVGVKFTKDANGDVEPASIEFLHWTGVSGNNLTLSDTGDRGLTGSASGAQASSAGAFFEVWVSSYYYQSLLDNSDIHAATEKTTPADADELGLIDSAASYVLKKLTWANVKATLKTYFDTLYNPLSATGWSAVSDTWTYASATTITVPSGAASLYQKGDKIKLTANSVVLYAYIVGVADTVLTVLGNPLTNHTFSSVSFSRAESPFGFPTTFSYTPTFASGGTQPALGSSTISGKFFINGNVCWYTGKLTVVTGGAWSAGTGTYRFGLPLTSSAQQYRGQGTAFDNGTADYPQLTETQASTAYCILVQCSNGNNVGATVPMTPASNDYYLWTGFFDF